MRKHGIPASTLLLFLLVFASLTSVSCGKKKHRFDNPVEQRIPVNGSVTKAAEENFRSDELDECDLKFKSQILEIAGALDSREQEISALSETQAESAAQTESSLLLAKSSGPKMVSDYLFTEVTPQEPAGADSFQYYETGWSELIPLYNEIKNSPTSGKWQSLNRSVRSQLTDDQGRLIYYQNPTLDSRGRSKVESALALVNSCLALTGCADPSFTSSDVLTYLQSGAGTNYWLRQSKAVGTFSGKRDALEALGKWIERDLKSYQFRKEPSVTLRNGELSVPFQMQSFGANAQVIAEYFQSVVSKWWEMNGVSGTYRIRLDIPKDPIAEIFKILYVNEPGGRAYVSYQDNSLALYPAVKDSSIAHEVGHVLGFWDNYYTSYDKRTCLYRIEQRPADLMSDTTHGRILPEHWTALKAAYEVQ